MLAHRCGERGCNKYIDIDIRYCEKHAKLHVWKQSSKEKKQAYKHYNQHARDKGADSFYHSSKWTKVRDYVYARDMATDQVTGDATKNTLIVDHIIPLRLCKEEQRLDPNNLWCLSRSTHSIKTKMEQNITAKNNGENTLQHLSKAWWTKVLKEKIKENNRHEK
ncbi:HNH endonuclease [Liquorilactobacillus hordei]|uniref:HNH endonuclease n=1 Tax=Liquorilactobacillus hordei TaxID=468911 RepID=UPI0039EC0A68